MLRLRRYRVFLLLAIVTVILLYRFSQPSQWEASTSAAALKDRIGLGHHTSDQDRSSDEDKPPKRPQSQPSKPQQEHPNPPKIPPSEATKVAPPKEEIPKPTQNVPVPKTGEQKVGIDQQPPVAPGDPANSDGEIILSEGGEARLPIDHLPDNGPIERWSKMPEHYPVPTQSIIPLPTGKGKPIAKIQYNFKKETTEEKTKRLQQLDTIKEAFLHAWNGYKDKAWGKDELRPVSGTARNTFNGWSATLVDAMDTMWIMGLEKDFEASVEFVKTIDFYTSTRNEIPVFETVIRYLGGLIGAYDVSDGKYPVLLEKAKELGDLLMAAFDTPNRMPLTYYPWKNAFASQPHRSSRAVLAEIGSLQMEFTRLAQLTGNNSYYDAITRVVDALEVFQDNTTIPGLWPADIDTSGCAKTTTSYRAPSRDLTGTFTYPDEDKKDTDDPLSIPLKKPEPLVFSAKKSDPNSKPAPVIIKEPDNVPKTGLQDLAREMAAKKSDPVVYDVKNPSKEHKVKREPQNIPPIPKTPPNAVPEPGLMMAQASKSRGAQEDADPIYQAPEVEELCLSSGLSVINGIEKYTLGSTADSAFEYLPKQYLLLAGQVEKYRKMYEKAIDAANKHLLFRIMIPDEKRELYVSGELSILSYSATPIRQFRTEQSHLVCFVGGMYAMGAKLFDRPEDLDIAAKLTDACVWSYESTGTGVMPETFEVVKCNSLTDCKWNQTRWYEAIDPNAELRMDMYKEQMVTYQQQLAEAASISAAAAAATKTQEPEPDVAFAPPPKHTAQSIGPKKPAAKDPARGVVTEAQEDARPPPKGFDPHVKRPGPERHEHSKRDDTLVSAGQSAADEWKYISKPENDDRPTAASNDDTSYAPPTLIETAPPAIWSPRKPETREEYAKEQINEYHLKPGMQSVRDGRYLLRPEALESVYYMHRITGSPYWRKQGWKMVSSILAATRTPHGHASVRDVMAPGTPSHDDEMESFWLAETLKYAWLLFEEEDKWSLDEWVLNTEAHLFKRPKNVAA